MSGCVYVAHDPDTLEIVVATSPDGKSNLRFSAAEWRAFIIGIREGEMSFGLDVDKYKKVTVDL